MVTKVETSDEMNIWLNPKYSFTMYNQQPFLGNCYQGRVQRLSALKIVRDSAGAPMSIIR